MYVYTVYMFSVVSSVFTLNLKQKKLAVVVSNSFMMLNDPVETFTH